MSSLFDTPTAVGEPSGAPSPDSETKSSEPIPGFQLSMHDLTQMVMESMSHPTFMDTFAPIVANVLSPLLHKTIQSALIPLEVKVSTQQSLINDQQLQIDAQKAMIETLKSANKNLEHKVTKMERHVDELVSLDLGTRVPSLEEGLEDLEQYGRRNSLRFHNVTIPEGEKDTDKVIVDLCAQKLQVTITKDDICRSHPVGRPKRNGKCQLICRFRNWKIKKFHLLN